MENEKDALCAGLGKLCPAMGILFLKPFLLPVMERTASDVAAILPLKSPKGDFRGIYAAELPDVQTASPCIYNLHILPSPKAHKYGLFYRVVAICIFCALSNPHFSSLLHTLERPFHGLLRNYLTEFGELRSGKKKGHKRG